MYIYEMATEITFEKYQLLTLVAGGSVEILESRLASECTMGWLR